MLQVKFNKLLCRVLTKYFPVLCRDEKNDCLILRRIENEFKSLCSNMHTIFIYLCM